METYKKDFIIKNKKTDEFYSAYVKLELRKVEGRRFDTLTKGEFIAISITGNLYYHEREGIRGIGSYGQINKELEKLDSNWQIPYKLKRLLKIWDEWHLNNLIAGTKKQVEALKKYRFDGYDEQVEFLKSIGLYCDKGYKYGSSWLIKPVPDEIIMELKQILIEENNIINKREEVLKVIQETMSNEQFWKWVSSWFSIDLIIDIVKNWDDDIIKEEYNKFKKRGLIK